ncbi:MAG: cytochrome c [Acidobacteriia bacterium]|nr:cytochrome c [Terriglobia bacterium]
MSKPAVLAIAGIALLCGVYSGIGAGQNKQSKKQTDGADSIRLIDSIQGPNLYKAYCAVCHGPNAKGDGPMAMFLKTAPPDLTRIAVRNNGMFPLAKVRRVIAGEDPLPAGHGTLTMPVWGPIFSQVAWDQDLGRVRIDNLARYLESLQGK